MKRYHLINVKLAGNGIEFLAKVKEADVAAFREWLKTSPCVASHRAVGSAFKETLNGSRSKIAQVRKEVCWTQQDLADALGVPQQQVQRWEAKRARAQTATLKRMGEIMGVDWTRLVDDD